MRTSSNSSAATSAPTAASRQPTRQFGIIWYITVKPIHVTTNGNTAHNRMPNTPRSATPWISGCAYTQELTPTPVANSSGPSVSAAQYIRKRALPLRGDCTRQMRLKRSSMLAIIIKALTSSTNTPTAVRRLALSANCSRYPCTAWPAAGTKWRKMNSDTRPRNAENTGNADRIANTAASSGTIANSDVKDNAPAVSKHLSSRKRRHRKCANARSLSRSMRRWRMPGWCMPRA